MPRHPKWSIAIASGSASNPTLTDILDRLRACEWVDLTHAFAPGIPHYVEFPDEVRTCSSTTTRGSGSAVRGSSRTSTGTSVSGHAYGSARSLHARWSHPGRGRRAGDDPRARVIDVREACAADPDYACTRSAVEAWETRHGRVPAGAFVALHTGWDTRWPDDSAMQNRDADGVAHFPGWAVDALELLVEERGITAIGHDMTDTDPGATVSGGDAPAETYILGADRWQIELLANLEARACDRCADRRHLAQAPPRIGLSGPRVRDCPT